MEDAIVDGANPTTFGPWDAQPARVNGATR
jgi:hypothetical protein